MTGFSFEWLSLREPVDHRSRNSSLLKRMARHFEGLPFNAKNPMRLTDLGCGTGSNLRALADSMPEFQHWTLVDYDPALLQAARVAIVSWADTLQVENIDQARTSASSTAPLNVTYKGKDIRIEFVCDDLSLNIEKILTIPTDLVTAAAFFDLVSQDWLMRFAAALSTPLYTVLTYNGQENWYPSTQTDEVVLAAFHEHQQIDKGFGCAAGPLATEILVDTLNKRGFHLQTAPSPWVLNQPIDQKLIAALANGSAQAVNQISKVNPDHVERWLARSTCAYRCVIGHTDLWASR